MKFLLLQKLFSRFLKLQEPPQPPQAECIYAYGVERGLQISVSKLGNDFFCGLSCDVELIWQNQYPGTKPNWQYPRENEYLFCMVLGKKIFSAIETVRETFKDEYLYPISELDIQNGFKK